MVTFFERRLSNTNEEGLWIFRVGDIGLEANVESPNVRQIPLEQGIA